MLLDLFLFCIVFCVIVGIPCAAVAYMTGPALQRAGDDHNG